MLEWANSKPWIWAQELLELVSPPTLLHSYHQGKLSCPAPAGPSNGTVSKGQSQLSQSYALWAVSSASLTPGLALLCCRWQGQEGGDENIFLTEAITGQTKGRSLLSHIHFFRAGLPKIPKSRASFYSASWSMCGITLLSTAAGRSPDLIPQEQFSQDSQVRGGVSCV